MRFTIASLFFIFASFFFFISWAVTSFMLNEMYTAMSNAGASQNLNANFESIISLMNTGFGIICVIFFICAIVVVFVLDAFADEPEMYWRR